MTTKLGIYFRNIFPDDDPGKGGATSDTIFIYNRSIKLSWGACNSKAPFGKIMAAANKNKRKFFIWVLMLSDFISS